MSVLEAQPTLFLPGAQHRTACAAHPVHAVLFATGLIELTECEPVAHAVMAVASKELDTLACCLMPDRFEWLLASGVKLVPGVDRVMDLSACVAGRLGILEPLWSGGCIEVPVEPDRLREAARAIQELPVREGLVEKIPNWPYQLRRI